LELLKTIAASPWYAVQTGHAYQRLQKDAFRLTEFVIRASQVAAIESVEVPIIHDPKDIFRLGARIANESEFRVTTDSLSLCGENEPLSRLALLPRPTKVSLVWKRIEYSLGQVDGHRPRFVTVPDALILEGLHGRVVLVQDDAPSWLRMDLDEALIRRALDEAEHVDELI
jgi:hypothetical protein